MTDQVQVVDNGVEHDPLFMTRDEMIDHVEAEHPSLEQLDPEWRVQPWLSHAALHNGEAEKITFHQAFGTNNDAEPHLKEHVQPKHQSAFNECHNGVHSIDVKTYGDDPQGVFVDVNGIDKQAVIDAWFRVIQSEWWRKEWWGQSPTE